LYAFREAIKSIIRTRNMMLISILTITIALIMFVIVGIITLWTNGVVNKIQRGEEANVYLKDEMSDGDMLALDETIESMNEVEYTRIISKEDAAKEFEKTFGGNLLSALQNNPFPRSIVITMSKGHRMSSDFEKVAERIRLVDGVESVEYGKEWISKLDIFFLIFAIIETFLITFIVSACILVISNTITLTVISRKEAIEVMQLVGATDGFIRRPLYFEGFLQGLVSGIIAFVIFYGIYLWIHHTFPDIEIYLYMFGMTGVWYFSYPLVISLIIPVGGFLGLLGSYVAVRRAF